MKCLRTGAIILSDVWNRQPVCNCKNCDEYFYQCRTIGREETNKKYERKT